MTGNCNNSSKHKSFLFFTNFCNVILWLQFCNVTAQCLKTFLETSLKGIGYTGKKLNKTKNDFFCLFNFLSVSDAVLVINTVKRTTSELRLSIGQLLRTEPHACVVVLTSTASETDTEKKKLLFIVGAQKVFSSLHKVNNS